MESQLAVLIAIPKHATLGELHDLLTHHGLALGKIRLVEREVNLLTADDAHGDVGLLSIII